MSGIHGDEFEMIRVIIELVTSSRTFVMCLKKAEWYARLPMVVSQMQGTYLWSFPDGFNLLATK